MASTGRVLKVGLVQMLTTKSKTNNLLKAAHYVRSAAQAGARLVVLPEFFNSPYGSKYISEYAEYICNNTDHTVLRPMTEGAGRETFSAMASAAKANHVWLIAGSIPERVDAAGQAPRYYNSTMVFNPAGELVALFRKIHLFKINTDELKFDESEFLSPGDAPVSFTMSDGGATVRIGLGICFDVRFPQLALHYSLAPQHTTDLIVYPSAFNLVTGPKHWRLMGQARAIDAQQHVILASPARTLDPALPGSFAAAHPESTKDEVAEYVPWGHSMVLDPMGQPIAELEEKEGLLVTDIDFGANDKARSMLPIRAGTRHDLYDLTFKH